MLTHVEGQYYIIINILVFKLQSPIAYPVLVNGTSYNKMMCVPPKYYEGLLTGDFNGNWSFHTIFISYLKLFHNIYPASDDQIYVFTIATLVSTFRIIVQLIVIYMIYSKTSNYCY